MKKSAEKITPFLWFDGRIEEGMEFYCSVFNDSRIVSVRRDGENVMAATIRLIGQEFIAFNSGPHDNLTPAFSFFVSSRTQREIDRRWERLSDGGEKQRCGWLKDKFGLSWQIMPTVLGKLMADTNPEKAGRVLQAMMKMSKLDI